MGGQRKTQEGFKRFHSVASTFFSQEWSARGGKCFNYELCRQRVGERDDVQPSPLLANELAHDKYGIACDGGFSRFYGHPNSRKSSGQGITAPIL